MNRKNIVISIQTYVQSHFYMTVIHVLVCPCVFSSRCIHVCHLAVSRADKQEGDRSRFTWWKPHFTRQKKRRAVEEIPGGDSESDDEVVLKKGGRSTVWN